MPRSLLSYFTASKSRAAACERRLLLDKPEGVEGNTLSNNARTTTGLSLEIMDHSNVLSDAVVTPYGDDLTNWPFTCDADVMKFDERLNVLCKHPNALPVRSDVVYCLM